MTKLAETTTRHARTYAAPERIAAQSGGFPLRAVNVARDWASERAALAIDEALSLGLYDDPDAFDVLAYGIAWQGLI